MLVPLQSALGETLRWRQRAWWREVHELSAGSDVVARLTQRGVFSWVLLAETAEDRWTLQPVGFWRRRLVLRHGDSDTDEAVLEGRFFGGGAIRLRDGRTFDWKQENFWGTRWTMRDTAGATVHSLAVPFFSLHDRGEVRVEAGAERDAALLELLLLGWYATVVQRRRSRSRS
jgi:hypothetical protein